MISVSNKFGVTLVLKHLAAIAFYIIISELGLSLASIEFDTSPVWPASGLAIAILVWWGQSFWISIFIASFTSSIMNHSETYSAAIIAISAAISALMSSSILKQVLNRDHLFKGHNELLAYLTASFGPSIISALAGTTTLWMDEPTTINELSTHFFTWWVGDSLGALILTPFLLAGFNSKSSREWVHFYKLSSLIKISLYAIICAVVFFSKAAPYIPFLIYPSLLLFSKNGSLQIKLMVVVTAILGIIAAVNGMGPFTGGSLNQDLICLQLFLASVSVTGLAIGELSRNGQLKLPALGLISIWIATAAVYLSFILSEAKQEKLRFQHLSKEVVDGVKEKIKSYEDILRGGAGLVAASKNVSKEEWKTYVLSSKSNERYEGSEGIGVLKRLDSKKDINYFKSFISKVHKKKIEIKKISSTKENQQPINAKIKYIVTHIEPPGPNAESIGLDLGSELKRKQTIEKAIKSGEPAISEKIELHQPFYDRIGFLIFVPIFDTTLPIRTEQERVKALKGIVFSPFVARKFFKAILGNPANELKVNVYLGSDSNPNNLIYSSTDPESFSNLDFTRYTDEIGQQQFTFHFAKSPFFLSEQDTSGAWILICGSFIAVLLGGLISSLQGLNKKAEEIAQAKTTELAKSEAKIKQLNVELEDRVAKRTAEIEKANELLREKEARFRNMADSMPQIAWTMESTGLPNYFNLQWWKYTGQSPETFNPQDSLSLIHPQDHDAVLAEWTKCHTTGQLFEIEYRIRRFDGVYRWHLGRIVPTFDKNGTFVAGYGTATDIDDHKKTVEALEKSEHHFRQLTDSLPQIVWTALPDGTVNYMNEKWFEFSGFSRDTIGDSSWLPIMPKEDGERTLAEWYRCVKEVVPFEIEYRFWDRKTHQYLWYLGRALPVKDEKGAVVKWIGTCTNIDEKKKAEEALTHMAAIIESSEDAIIGEDLLGNITDWNHSAESIYQYSAAEIIDKTALTLFPADKIYEEMMILESVKQGKFIRHFETEQIRKDGTRFPISVSVSPILNAKKEISGLSKIVRDITDEKRISSALKESEKQLSIVTNVIPGMLFYISKDKKFLYMNKITEKMLGVEPNAIVGKYMEEVLGPTHYSVAEPHVNKVLSGKTSSFEDVIKDNQGNDIIINVKYVPDTNEKGEVQGFVALALDITEQRNFEEERYQSSVRERAALEASALKSEFLANMSHEVRTPISGVIGMAQLLKTTKLTNEQKEYVEAISQSGDLLLSVVNDILDFSRVEAGKLPLENIEFNYSTTINHIKTSFAPMAESKGIEFIVNTSKNLENITLIGDPNRLRQILGNLVSNAIKFTHEGSVTICTSGDLVKDANQDYLNFKAEIRDTGIGISESDLNKLFHPFTQADGSTSRKYGGSGLGLSISKKLVEMMGGNIFVNSSVGSGSCFTVEIKFPVSRSQENQNHGSNKQSKKQLLKNIKVLVAEDNQINQKIIEKNLQDLGASPKLVTNGFEVIKYLNSEHFDIVLMDCQMPDLDGFQTTEEIRKLKNPKVSNIPIIAITANAMSDDKIKCIKSGMNDYLPKPIKKDDLEICIGKWVYIKNHHKEVLAKTFCPESLESLYKFRSNSSNKQLVKTVLNAFLSDFENQISGLEKSVNNKDLKKANLIAHTLRSSVAAVGGIALSEHLKILEQISKNENSESECMKILKKINKESILLCNEINLFLSSELN